MIKTKNKKDLPSPLVGMVRKFSKKVIILLIAIIMSLSFLLMPCTINANTYMPSEVSAKTLANDREIYIKAIINSYIQNFEDNGYVDVVWELSPTANPMDIDLRIIDFTNKQNIEHLVLKNIVFYANYSVVSENEETVYYFKTPQESDNFITEIHKYENIEFNKSTVKEIIGIETSQDILDNAIESKKIIAEKREAERREEEARKIAAMQKRTQSFQITDNTPVSDNAIVNYALQFVGNPYVYGGTSLTDGADCSGFVQSIYGCFGISLPRTASTQVNAGQYVSWGELQPGDIIFYSGDGGNSITHVAIYIGNSKIVHASNPSDGIQVSSANIMTKMTARRVI